MPVTRNFGPLTNLKLTTSALMREIGLLARERILRRTAEGRSSDGTPFKPYSRGYAARKAAELGTSKPNLTVSGDMLGAIQITRVTEDEVVLEIVR
jgi:hypothetical protein